VGLLDGELGVPGELAGIVGDRLRMLEIDCKRDGFLINEQLFECEGHLRDDGRVER
jgi:hypothetical protein